MIMVGSRGPVYRKPGLIAIRLCKGNCKLDLAKLAGGPKSILFK